jgi:hypothetical protein
MKVEENQFLSQLYTSFLYQQAEIRVLKALLLKHLAADMGANYDNLNKTYEDNIPAVFESEILSSPLRDEYLQDQSEKALQILKMN